MQRTIRAFLIATTLLQPVSGWAETPDEAGAKRVEEAVKTYGPDRLSRSGTVQVSPNSDSYMMVLDIAKLIGDAVAPMKVKEAAPLAFKLVEQTDGKWAFDSSAPFALTTEYLAADRSANLTVKTETGLIKGLFDPAILFPRDANIAFTNAVASLKNSRDTLRIGVKDGTLFSGVKDLLDGRGDIDGTFVFSDIGATHGAFPNPEVKVSAERVEGTYKLSKVNLDGLAASRHFWQVTAHDRSIAALSDAQRAEIKAIVAKSSPVIDALGAKAIASKLAATEGGKGFRIERLEYDMRWEGLAGRGKLITTVHLANLGIDPGVWPKGFEAILPREAVVNATLSGFDMGAVLNDVTELDSRSTFATKLSRDQSMKRAYPDGTLTLSFADSFVRSSFYEFALSGELEAVVDRRKPPVGTLVVTAKNFDGTLKYLQDNANTAPIFGRFAMMAAVAKGLGKPGPDGATVWEIKADETGRPTINGQALPGR